MTIYCAKCRVGRAPVAFERTVSCDISHKGETVDGLSQCRLRGNAYRNAFGPHRWQIMSMKGCRERAMPLIESRKKAPCANTVTKRIHALQRILSTMRRRQFCSYATPLGNKIRCCYFHLLHTQFALEIREIAPDMPGSIDPGTIRIHDAGPEIPPKIFEIVCLVKRLLMKYSVPDKKAFDEASTS